ncbi:MAG TPA: hypothetical protein DCR15_13740, partial [Arthrobacter bacterium]|nr:hypothetical protein [Arthrobacter sp.]
MSDGELSAAQIRALLQELGRRLQARGVHDVKPVGGAALHLQGIGNRPTADIDAGLPSGCVASVPYNGNRK